MLFQVRYLHNILSNGLLFNDILETRLMLVCNLTHIGCLVMFDTQFPNVLHQCLL